MTTSGPRALVFQPLHTPGAPYDFRMLGFQWWLADRLTELGSVGMSALYTAKESGPRRLMACILRTTTRSVG